MRFEDTGLKNDPVVEAAFNYAQDYNKSLAPEILAQMQDTLNNIYQSNLDRLDMAKEDGQISEDQYKASKAKLDEVVEKRKAAIPALVEKQLSMMFNKARLAPVLELQQYSENAAPALLAASLLIDCVRDPVDYQHVDATFGGAVSGLVAEVLHIDSYPGSADANMAAASPDAKRLMLANLTTSLNDIPAQIAKVPAGMQIQFPPKQEETLFHTAKLLWGNDKKQDARLLDVFNRAVAAMGSNYQMEVGANGPELVAGAPKAPKNTPKGPKGPSLSGDDGF